MVGHGGSSAGSYVADPTSPIPSHCASIAATNIYKLILAMDFIYMYWLVGWLSCLMTPGLSKDIRCRV